MVHLTNDRLEAPVLRPARTSCALPQPKRWRRAERCRPMHRAGQACRGTFRRSKARGPVCYPVSFIVGYPDFGAALAPAVQAAEAAGIPYISFSAGYVGLPGSEGALTPGEDYTAVVGEDLCALGNSFAEILNGNVAAAGEVGLLGGTPNNALTLGWQQCIVPALSDGGLVVANPPANENTTTGDTYWVNSFALDAVTALLTTNPEIQGWAYEYSDGLFTALQAYDNLGVPVQNLSVALRTDEQTLFCDWVDRAEPTYNIWFSAGGNFQSRTGVTAAWGSS